VGVAILQHGKIAEGIDQARASRAAFVPCRIEHEVIYDQLTLAVKKIAERNLSAWSFENVFLLQANHREPASFGGHAVSVFREFFLVCEELFAASEPFFAGCDWRVGDRFGGHKVGELMQS
jgi:hypothetical protein